MLIFLQLLQQNTDTHNLKEGSFNLCRGFAGSSPWCVDYKAEIAR